MNKITIIYTYFQRKVERLVAKHVPNEKWLPLAEMKKGRLMVKFYDYYLSDCSDLPCLVFALTPSNVVLTSNMTDCSSIDIGALKKDWLSFYNNFSTTGYGKVDEDIDEDEDYYVL